MPGRLPIRAGGDDGSTLILTIFYGFLAMVLILIVVAATSLYLERKRLLTLADGAALAGAEAFNLGEVTVAGDGSGGVLRPALSSAEVWAGHGVSRRRPARPDGGAEGERRGIRGRAERHGLADRLLAPAGAEHPAAGGGAARGHGGGAVGVPLALA
ncbi:hypothetical protein E3T49_11095 [Cryobacterium cryoconiti]|uniref:Putative Flp pilus-assembly TadG-like N-terminal domain-containing protein n=2 Tax=Cryobacterium cryoconiti TaxID=1259239 RepID=A0A4Y8JTY3_9MICO|nr:hypothetical protein E3T49_11095 [Cryobacterium cryoconiti]